MNNFPGQKINTQSLAQPKGLWLNRFEKIFGTLIIILGFIPLPFIGTALTGLLLLVMMPLYGPIVILTLFMKNYPVLAGCLMLIIPIVTYPALICIVFIFFNIRIMQLVKTHTLPGSQVLRIIRLILYVCVPILSFYYYSKYT